MISKDRIQRILGLVFLLSGVSVAAYSSGLEGVIVYKTVHADPAVVEGAMMNRSGQEEMAEYPEEGGILEYAKEVFQLTLQDLERAADDLGMEEGLEIEEGRLSIAPDRFRYDGEMDGQRMSYIMLLDEKLIRHVLWDRNAYMEIDLAEMKKMLENIADSVKRMTERMGAGSGAADDTDLPKPVLVRTGGKKTINGFACEEVLAYDEYSAVQAWTAGDPGIRKLFGEWENALETMSGGMGEESDGLANLIDSLERLPVLQKTIRDGSLEIEEVVRFTKQPVDRVLFEVPANFQKRSMQEMMQIHGS